MWDDWRMMCLVMLALGSGCSWRPTTVGLKGEVSYEGRPVASGTIEFVPTGDTVGRSTGAPIIDGRYELPQERGLLPDGNYTVRIRAFKKTGKMAPRPPGMPGPPGPPVEMTENFIPAMYNSGSTLKVRVSELPDKMKADFHLGKR